MDTKDLLGIEYQRIAGGRKFELESDLLLRERLSSLRPTLVCGLLRLPVSVGDADLALFEGRLADLVEGGPAADNAAVDQYRRLSDLLSGRILRLDEISFAAGFSVFFSAGFSFVAVSSAFFSTGFCVAGSCAVTIWVKNSTAIANGVKVLKREITNLFSPWYKTREGLRIPDCSIFTCAY